MSSITHKIPENFICPITWDIMRDPVICDDGFVYDRHAIIKVKPAISPFTRQPINLNNLKSNTRLKKLIDKFIRKNNIILEPIDHIVNIDNNNTQITQINQIEQKYILVSTFYYKDIIGIKVRGIFDNILQAERRASYLHQIDKYHNIVIGDTTCHFPLIDNNYGSTISHITQPIQTQQDFLDEDPCLQINRKDQKAFLISIDMETKTYMILDGYETFNDAIHNINKWTNIYPYNDIYVGSIGLWKPISLSNSNSNSSELLNTYIGQYKASFN